MTCLTIKLAPDTLLNVDYKILARAIANTSDNVKNFNNSSLILGIISVFWLPFVEVFAAARQIVNVLGLYLCHILQ